MWLWPKLLATTQCSIAPFYVQCTQFHFHIAGCWGAGSTDVLHRALFFSTVSIFPKYLTYVHLRPGSHLCWWLRKGLLTVNCVYYICVIEKELKGGGIVNSLSSWWMGGLLKMKKEERDWCYSWDTSHEPEGIRNSQKHKIAIGKIISSWWNIKYF